MVPTDPHAFDPSHLPSAPAIRRFGEAPSGPASREPPNDGDDLGWDLPDDEGAESARDDENFDPDDDSDFGLEQDDQEEVGLDTDTGFDEGGEDLELDDSGEDERWTIDSEAADELPGADADVISGEEYGYIGEDDTSEAEEDLESDLDDEPLPNLDDGGAEGVEDETDLDDFELAGLPDLETAAEEEAEGFVSDNLEDLAGVHLTDEPMLELVPGQPWKLLAAKAVQLTRVATLPGPALALAGLGPRFALCAGDGWFLGTARTGLARLAVEAPPGQSLALAEHDGRLVLALASPSGLFLSFDGGRSFELQRENDPPAQVAFTQHVGKLRIWVRTQRGMLLASDDAGRSFNPARLDGHVLVFASDGDRRLCALVKRASRTALGMSNDSGRRWSWVDASDFAGESPQLFPGRGLAVMAGTTRVHCVQAGQTSASLAPLLAAPAVLLDEDDESFVYACAARDDQVSIVRCATRGGAPPMVIASLARERTGEPRFLAAAYGDGGFVTLYVATDQALLRVEASLDGDELP